MSTLGNALRYLGLSGEGDGEPSSERSTSAVRGESGRGQEGAAIGAGLSFRGEVTGEGDFHIAGKFEGELSVSGRVFVASGAQVDANINALAIVIGGAVRGNLSASTRVEILPTGVLTGSLKTGSFSAADGASVKGEVWVEPGSARSSGTAPKP